MTLACSLSKIIVLSIYIKGELSKGLEPYLRMLSTGNLRG